METDHLNLVLRTDLEKVKWSDRGLEERNCLTEGRKQRTQRQERREDQVHSAEMWWTRCCYVPHKTDGAWPGWDNQIFTWFDWSILRENHVTGTAVERFQRPNWEADRKTSCRVTQQEPFCPLREASLQQTLSEAWCLVWSMPGKKTNCRSNWNKGPSM